MHIKRYDYDYSRRYFMEKTAKGLGSAGILSAWWPLMAHSGDSYRAYPEELTNIEAYTKGKIKVGDTISKDHVELVQDLLDPMVYQEVAQDQRTFFILPTQTKIEEQFPPFFMDATLKNWGQAQFGKNGNVYTKEGKPWIGGHPFPDRRPARRRWPTSSCHGGVTTRTSSQSRPMPWTRKATFSTNSTSCGRRRRPPAWFIRTAVGLI